MLGGKVASLSGRYVDGTSFESENEEDLRKELRHAGFKDDGSETMYNPITGEQYKVDIFVGNIYYLRLKHMVANKLHSRARGPIQLLTRQPTEGRAKEGGLRLGEMEKDTFIAHGASLTLKERFDSDSVVVPICEKSGTLGYYDARRNNKAISSIHDEDSEMSDIEISYAFRLLLDEFKALGLYPKLRLKSKF
jgi:DNA-directed RNA polymerase beta subunit